MKKALLVLFGIVAFGSFASDLCAQQRVNNTSQVENTPAKACILVFGAVRSPGLIETQNIRLAEAIKKVGGVTERASGSIQIIHSSNAIICSAPDDPDTLPATTELGPPTQSPPSMDLYTLSDLRSENLAGNPNLRSGDFVVVVEAPPVYVAGKVGVPQALFLRDRMTLTQAIAMAGGVLRDGNPKKVRLIRSTAGNPSREVIVIDLNAIRKHKAEDPVLQPYDIIEVPERHRNHEMHRLFDARQLPLRVIT